MLNVTKFLENWGYNMRIYGFTLYQFEQKIKGNLYKYWGAQKRINNKLHTVHIGKNPAKAEVKIVAYCQKKGINLEIIGQAVEKEAENNKKIKDLEAKIAILEAQLKEELETL